MNLADESMQAMKASLPRADDDDDDDDDSGVEGCRSGPDESASSDTEGDYLGPSDFERGSDVDWEFGDVGLSFAEASDVDDLVNLDPEIPVDVTMEEQTGFGAELSPAFGSESVNGLTAGKSG